MPKSLYEYNVPVTLREPTPSDLELGYIRKQSAASWTFTDDDVSGLEQGVAPPAYGETPSSSSIAKTKSSSSVFGTLFSCLRRNRSRPDVVAPPPYVSAEEIALMEERIRELDTFFGGAAL